MVDYLISVTMKYETFRKSRSNRTHKYVEYVLISAHKNILNTIIYTNLYLIQIVLNYAKLPMVKNWARFKLFRVFAHLYTSQDTSVSSCKQ